MIQPIPAIDLVEGKCVRLCKGDYQQMTVYSDCPLDMAMRLEDMGFKRIHIVDLEGAKSQHVVNIDTLRQITSNTRLLVDFGGGLKTDDDLQKAFDNGASLVTIGSVAATDPERMERWMQRFGAEKIILGADAKDGLIAVNGWKEQTQLQLLPYLRHYIQMGITQVLCTDISRDGMMRGPSFQLYSEIMKAFPQLYLIASGGISCNEDIEKLDAAGVPAVVFGKAFYEGMIDIQKLLNR